MSVYVVKHLLLLLLLLIIINGVNRTYRVTVYICSVDNYAHCCVTGLEVERTARVENEKFSLEDYHSIKFLGRGSFGSVSLVERTPTICSGGKRDVFAMKCVRKRATKYTASRKIVEKEVFMHSIGHPYLVQLHAFFETMVLIVFKCSCFFWQY